MSSRMTHSEAMALIAKKGEWLGRVWALTPTPWIPDDVVKEFDDSISAVLSRIDLDDRGWWETNWLAERVVSRNPAEVEEMLRSELRSHMRSSYNTQKVGRVDKETLEQAERLK